MANVKSATGKMKGYALVRDAQGKPKIDNIDTCPQEILDMLTKEEIEELRNGTDTHDSD